jgi:predicted nucleotidyltransferase
VNLNDPVATALVAAEALERAGHQYALMGGLLMAAYGEPRETRDADIAVVDLPVERAREALAVAGVECVVSIRDGGVTFGGLTVGRVTLLGGDEHLGLNVLDIVRTRSARYDAAAIERSVGVPIRGRTVRALTPEDFVIFKALATRDRDIEDAASVLRRSGDLLDLSLIEREVAKLATEIPDWDVRARWAAIRARV